MTTPPTLIQTASAGEAWLGACRAILRLGEPGHDGGRDLRELLHLTLHIQAPDPADRLIARGALPADLDWMAGNFREQKRVPELGNSPSYAIRLRNYQGRDQVAWVIDRLKAKPESKSATITTLLPDDVSYIPCVSLLDFKVRGNALLLGCACRSIDAGVKLPGNLVELARLQREVAGALGRPCGSLTLWIVSAHVYVEDLPRVAGLLAEEAPLE
jgi:thymidylate synthase